MIDKECLRDALRLVVPSHQIEGLLDRLDRSCRSHVEQGSSESQALVLGLHEIRSAAPPSHFRPVGLLVWIVILGSTLIYQYTVLVPRFKDVLSQVGVKKTPLVLAMMHVSEWMRYLWPAALLALAAPVWLIVSEWRTLPPRLGRAHLICGVLVLLLLVAVALTTHGLFSTLLHLLRGLGSRSG
jgi:hypothetical protein